jgi:hypothetical protein
MKNEIKQNEIELLEVILRASEVVVGASQELAKKFSDTPMLLSFMVEVFNASVGILMTKDEKFGESGFLFSSLAEEMSRDGSGPDEKIIRELVQMSLVKKQSIDKWLEEKEEKDGKKD